MPNFNPFIVGLFSGTLPWLGWAWPSVGQCSRTKTHL
jgi:hypothetical protein